MYLQEGEEHVKRRVKAILGDWDSLADWESRFAREVVEFVRVDAAELWERPPLDVINVKNGLLNVDTLDLQPHGPEFLSAIRIPVEYDPSATCSQTEAFLRQVYPRGLGQDLAWEIRGYLLAPDTSIQQAILQTGPGGNGKSTDLQAITALLGAETVSKVSLHDLMTNRFAAAELVGNWPTSVRIYRASGSPTRRCSKRSPEATGSEESESIDDPSVLRHSPDLFFRQTRCPTARIRLRPTTTDGLSYLLNAHFAARKRKSLDPS